MNLVEQIFNEVITPFLEPRIKKSSIKAVKGYVQGVQGARKVAIAAYSMSAMAAILVTGIVLMIVAIVGLLPIDPRAGLIGMFVVGAILTSVAGFLTFGGFKEEVWLEKSKANELMEAAIKPWETPYSIPDPRKILGGEPKAQASFDENRDLRGSTANLTPAPLQR